MGRKEASQFLAKSAMMAADWTGLVVGQGDEAPTATNAYERILGGLESVKRAPAANYAVEVFAFGEDWRGRIET